MANIKFFLDTRRTRPGSLSVLKLVITHNNTRSYVSLDAKLLPRQWDSKRSRVINHPDAEWLNVYVGEVQQHVNRTLLILKSDKLLPGMTANDIRDETERRINPDKVEKQQHVKQQKNLFAVRFVKFAESKK